MMYFKNTDNEIFAYDDEQIKQGYGKGLISITEEEKDLILAPTAEQLLEQQIAEDKLAREQLMLTGDTYSLNGIDYQISFTKDDGDGLVQVKSAFELGLANTVIVFENGTKLPITASEFITFASWFVTKRNEFFV